ncbi:MAG: amino-acid racemase [Solirubrobacteraceae bacterium]|nr:amino-acid racemase [Solirubrobacteraceae bacterium]
MRTIGLLGGMSCESTAVYYRLLNDLVRERLGGLHSADCLLRSVDFAEIAALQQAGEWDAAGDRLAVEARRLQDAGAELVVLCTNTMHKVADQIEAALDIPFVHIVDATAARLREPGHATVGLLGTAFTMEQDFYTERMAEHGITVLVPDTAERADVHRIIYDELCVNRVEPASRARYQEIVAGLAARGATAVISGCTEIGLLIGPGDVAIEFFDSTRQ